MRLNIHICCSYLLATITFVSASTHPSLQAPIQAFHFLLSAKAHHLVTINTLNLYNSWKHLYDNSGGSWSPQKEEWHSVWRPCLWVFTPEPNCVWHLFQTDLLGLVVFRDEESTEARWAAEMWEGSWWGSLWLIFPLANWQGEDKALIMNCDTLMSLSSADNTWSALLPFNLWYQWGKLHANKGFVSPAKTEHDF